MIGCLKYCLPASSLSAKASMSMLKSCKWWDAKVDQHGLIWNKEAPRRSSRKASRRMSQHDFQSQGPTRHASLRLPTCTIFTTCSIEQTDTLEIYWLGNGRSTRASDRSSKTQPADDHDQPTKAESVALVSMAPTWPPSSTFL